MSKIGVTETSLRIACSSPFSWTWIGRWWWPPKSTKPIHHQAAGHHAAPKLGLAGWEMHVHGAAGGLIQLLAGMWEMWKANTFAATAFSSYGGFWMGWALYGILKSVRPACATCSVS